MQTSQLSICTECASLSTLYKQVDCSIFQLTRNNWTNQSYGTKLFYSQELLGDLLRYKRILSRKVVNSNYLGMPTSKIASLLATRMYKPVGCPECDCVDYTDFIESWVDSTSTSTTTSFIPPPLPPVPPTTSSSTTTLAPMSSTTTTVLLSSTTTTLPEPQGAPVACGDPVTFAGGQTFPSAYEIVLGSGTGTVTLSYNMFSIPDKMIVFFDGIEVINTGYRGSSSYQSALDADLTSRGLPTEPIVGTGIGTANFNKNTSTTSAFVYVFAPLPDTAWQFILSCPT